MQAGATRGLSTRLRQVGHELRHLELRQVAAPPQVAAARLCRHERCVSVAMLSCTHPAAATRLGVLAQQDGQQVVGVHEHVHERVERGGEVGVAAGRGVRDHPPDEADAGVVVHVQHRHLHCQAGAVA
jgi:hypothetical protein